ncbi:MAG: prefoldin subunit [Janthinobacterium lividum]
MSTSPVVLIGDAVFGETSPPEHTAYRSSLSRLVLETLDPLPGTRKCFRMINGVLVERTVEDVIPALKTNSEGLKKVLDELVKQYKKQQEDMEKWKVPIFPYRLCNTSELTYLFLEKEQYTGCSTVADLVARDSKLNGVKFPKAADVSCNDLFSTRFAPRSGGVSQS